LSDVQYEVRWKDVAKHADGVEDASRRRAEVVVN
jgi:hypothetical protein